MDIVKNEPLALLERADSIIKNQLKMINLDNSDIINDCSHLVQRIDWEKMEALYLSWKNDGIHHEDGFFMQYNIPGFTEIRDHSDTLSEYLDNIAVVISGEFRKSIETHYGKKYRMSYTAKHIHVKENIDNKKLIDEKILELVDPREDEKFAQDILYEYIRLFILERGLALPDIVFDSYEAGSYIFSDDEYFAERPFAGILGRKPAPEVSPHIPAIRFITEIMKKSHTYEGLTSFCLGNAISFYLHASGKYIGKEDFSELLEPIRSNPHLYKNNMVWYLFYTEGITSFGVANFLQRIGVKNITLLEIETLEYMLRMSDYSHDEFSQVLLLKSTQGEPLRIVEQYPNQVKKTLIRKYDSTLVRQMMQEYNTEILKIGAIGLLFNDADLLFPKIQGLLTNSVQASHEGAGIASIVKDVSQNMSIIISEYSERMNRVKDKVAASVHLFGPLERLGIRNTGTIGGKIHFYDTPSEEQIHLLKHIMPKGGFSLIHANMTLNLPPCSNPIELVLILYRLEQIGVIRNSNLDLQLSIPSRLPENLCSILGSAMIFMKSYQVDYPEEAFRTSHDSLTGACMIAYDAGVLQKNGFKNMDPAWEGRTDILGIKKIEETFVYHVLGELLRGFHFKSKYKQAGEEFIDGYRKILKKYHIEWILEEKWVHNPTNPANMTVEDYKKHPRLIKQCTHILNGNIERYNDTGIKNGLIIFEIRELFSRVTSKYGLLYDFPRIHKTLGEILEKGNTAIHGFIANNL